MYFRTRCKITSFLLHIYWPIGTYSLTFISFGTNLLFTFFLYLSFCSFFFFFLCFPATGSTLGDAEHIFPVLYVHYPECHSGTLSLSPLFLPLSSLLIFIVSIVGLSLLLLLIVIVVYSISILDLGCLCAERILPTQIKNTPSNWL